MGENDRIISESRICVRRAIERCPPQTLNQTTKEARRKNVALRFFVWQMIGDGLYHSIGTKRTEKQFANLSLQ